MFGKSYPLFRLLGFEVRVDLTWLVLAVLVTWTLSRGVFPHLFEGLSPTVYWTMGVAGMLGLVFSIVFHEFAHSIVARREGLPIKGITLFIFGGVAQMDEEPSSARAEFLMAIAGPIASITLSGVLYAIYVAAGADQGFEPVTGVLFYLAYLNAILAVFNMVPAFPLDGGRVLRSLLWAWKSNLRSATRLAARIGSGFGTVLILLGLLAVLYGDFITGMWWFLIGMFLRAAAQMSYQQVLLRQMLAGERVERFMNEHVVTVAPDISLREFVHNYAYKFHYHWYPVAENDRLVGWISPRTVQHVPDAQLQQHTVREVCEPASPDQGVERGTDAVQALALLNRTGRSRLIVVENGRIVGIVTLKDLFELLSLKADVGDAGI